MLEQSKRIEREPVKSPITTLKLEQATELSKELDKMIAELIKELDVEALLAESIEFIQESEYSENLLDDLLNNDDLLDDLQDDLAVVPIVGIILLEFADQDANFWYLKGDLMVEEAECAALVPTKSEEIKFKKQTKARHLSPLYIKVHVNGKPVSRVLIDDGVVLNVIPYSMVKNLGKSHKGLEETNTVFFVVDVKLRYTILLGREWIHANQCVPSTLHQQLQFWNGDQVEIVEADPFPFTTDVRMQDVMLYSPKIESISWLEDIILDSIKSFDLSLDNFEVTVEANLWPRHNDGA